MTKAQQLLMYILDSYGVAGITVLMKLCYLSDLSMIRSGKDPITGYQYIRYNYGPFAKELYKDIQELVEQGMVVSEEVYEGIGHGNEYFHLAPTIEAPLLNLPPEDQDTIHTLLEKLKGYGAKSLTELSYNTGPMKALGATLGGNEHMCQTLTLQ